MKYGRNVGQSLVLVMQFGIDMLVPICMCSLVGWWLDQKLGTSWIFVALFFVGALAGGRNVYRFAKKIYAGQSGDVRNRDNAAGQPEEQSTTQSATQEVNDETTD